ncbi:hypothetical protein JW710_02400 [Candidatus Dojkabacteria bacterium]|nr:hypothetical protein [Candidatus Dojkabacteria bacterium]
MKKVKKTVTLITGVLIMILFAVVGVYHFLGKEEYDCEPVDRLFVTDNAIGKKLGEFENMLFECIGDENLIEFNEGGKTEEKVNGVRRYEYLGYGYVYVDGSEINRSETSFAAGDEGLYKKIVEEHGQSDMEYIYTSGIRGEYTAFVWLDDGYVLICYESVNDSENIVVGYVRFEPRFSEDEFKKEFIEDPDTKIRVSMMEI